MEQLENPVKNFAFLGHTFWTGTYKGKRVTVGNGGFYAPDTAFAIEIICAAGVEKLIRIGSCGALDEKMEIGDFFVADKVIRGDGVTRYYVEDDYEPKVDGDLTATLEKAFQGVGNVHKGGVWTTDAIFKETKEIVNSYIEKGANAVDMVSSPFVTISNIYEKQAGVVMVVSDNLITGKMGFTDYKYFTAEQQMVKTVLESVLLSY